MASTMPRPLLIVFAAAFILRLFLFSLIIGYSSEGLILTRDSLGFLQTAKNIVSGNGFSKGFEPPYAAEAHFPPIYPLIIAGSLALTNSLIPVIVLQIILSSFIPLLIWLIGKRIINSQKGLVFASTLGAFEPTMILWSILLLTEVTAIFFLLIAFYFFILFFESAKIRWAALAGAFLGLSTLVRPHAQLLSLLAFAALLGLGLWKFNGWKNIIKKFLPAAVFALAFIFIMSPWMLRNYYQFGSFSVATTGLRNIYSSIGASVLSADTGRPFTEVQNELHQKFSRKYKVEVREIKQNPALGSTLAKEGFLIIASHPKATAKLIAINTVAFFTQDLYLVYLKHFHLVPSFSFEFSPSLVLVNEGPISLAKKVWDFLGFYSVIPVIGRLFWTLLTFLWVWAAVHLTRKGQEEKKYVFMMLALVFFYLTTSMAAGFSEYGRFRYPASSFLFILASYAAVNLLPRLKKI